MKLTPAEIRLGLIVIFFGVLAIFALKKCSKKENIQHIETAVVLPAPDTHVADSFKAVEIARKKEIEIVTRKADSLAVVARKAVARSVTLAAELKAVKQAKDTAGVFAVADSLVAVNADLAEQLQNSDENCRAIIESYSLALGAADSSALHYTQLYSQLRSSYDDLVANNKENAVMYNQLADKYNKQNKKLRGNQGVKKVLAGGLAIAAGIIIFK